MAIWSAGFVQHLPAPSMVRWQSCPSTIGHITLGPKQTGAPSAGNPHAGCDVAGAGNGFTVWLMRHSQRKRGETDRPDLRNTAPALDPTHRVLEHYWNNQNRRVSNRVIHFGGCSSGSDLPVV